MPLLLTEDSEVQFALGRGRDVEVAVAKSRPFALEPPLGAFGIELSAISIVARPDVGHGAVGELEAELQGLFDLGE